MVGFDANCFERGVTYQPHSVSWAILVAYEVMITLYSVLRPSNEVLYRSCQIALTFHSLLYQRRTHVTSPSATTTQISCPKLPLASVRV